MAQVTTLLAVCQMLMVVSNRSHYPIQRPAEIVFLYGVMACGRGVRARLEGLAAHAV